MLCSTYPECTEPLKEPLDNDWDLKSFLWPTFLTTLYPRKSKRIKIVAAVFFPFFFFFSSACSPEKRKHSLPWQRWHLPAEDHRRLTAHRLATAPPAHFAQRARWVHPAILWTPFSSLFSTPQIIPAFLETRSLGELAVWPPSPNTADPRMDTRVRLAIFLLSFTMINWFLSPVPPKV